MEYSSREIDQKEFDRMMKMLKAKDKYLRANKLDCLPAIYDNGQKVGVFFDKPTPWHTTGIVINYEGGFSVDILREDGTILNDLSPFQLFALEESFVRMKAH